MKNKNKKTKLSFFFLFLILEHSSVYFDSSDNTSDDEENFGDETLQMNS